MKILFSLFFRKIPISICDLICFPHWYLCDDSLLLTALCKHCGTFPMDTIEYWVKKAKKKTQNRRYQWGNFFKIADTNGDFSKKKVKKNTFFFRCEYHNLYPNKSCAVPCMHFAGIKGHSHSLFIIIKINSLGALKKYINFGC